MLIVNDDYELYIEKISPFHRNLAIMVKHHNGAYRARRKEKLIALARAIHERTGEQLVPINFNQRNELFPDHWDEDGYRLVEVNGKAF